MSDEPNTITRREFTALSTFPIKVAAGGTQTLAVGFAPKAAGPRAGKMTLMSNDPVLLHAPSDASMRPLDAAAPGGKPLAAWPLLGQSDQPRRTT